MGMNNVPSFLFLILQLILALATKNIQLSDDVDKKYPACRILQAHQECLNVEDNDETIDQIYLTVIAIGDIHGSYGGLLEDLYSANLTANDDACEWKHQNKSTLVVQMGDIVDRGNGSLATWKCLRKLQSEADLFNIKLVRLLGNHELWWLEGHFHQRNKEVDTFEVAMEMVQYMVEDIVAGRVLGAFIHRIKEVPLLFTHAGVGPNFYKFIQQSLPLNFSVDTIAEYVNSRLMQSASQCSQFPCHFAGEVFDSGPDRGGRGIGGPFWTDFSVLESGAVKHPNHDFIQVVGHTMAYCYDPRRIGVHPPRSQAECADGLVRSTPGLQSICVDGGMYAGARAFLEINSQGHFLAHQLVVERVSDTALWSGKQVTKWITRDMTVDYCKD